MPEQQKPSLPLAGELGALWCVLMRDSPMWPIHGEYQCRTCGRRYLVPWAEGNQSQVPRSHRSVLRSAALPLLIALLLLVVPGARASGSPIVESSNPAGTAFARYIAGLDGVHPWTLETIDIQASLPKQRKAGRLRAVRRLLPFGKPQFQVLESDGDATVKRQVIVRYLSAEVDAAGIPSAEVAITPSNYKFRYKGETSIGGGIAYVFQITPRKKREGLIQGELWLDGETGIAIRQSGRLVKSPSFFLKRVDVTREIELHDGVAQARVTHVTVAARFLGLAELNILEQPFEASDDVPVPPGER